MPKDLHPLERRVEGIAGGITHRLEALGVMLAPRGRREPFTEQLPRSEALAFWKQNINTPHGQEALKRLDPIDVMDLKRALAQDAQTEMPTPPDYGGEGYG